MYDSRGGKKISLFTKLSQLIDAIPNFWKQKVKVQGRDNNKSHQHSTKPTVTSKGITSKQSRNILETIYLQQTVVAAAWALGS